MSTITWIAFRRLAAEDGSEVEVALGQPEQVSDHEWRCAIRIGGAGVADFAHGEDAFQALILGVEKIRLAVERSGRKLTWAGGEPGDAGLPRIIPHFYGLAFAQRLSTIVDTEIEHHARTLAERDPKQG